MPSLDRPIRPLAMLLLAAAALTLAAPAGLSASPEPPGRKKGNAISKQTASTSKGANKRAKSTKHERRRGGNKGTSSRGAANGTTPSSRSGGATSSGSRSGGSKSGGSSGSGSKSGSGGSSSRSSGSGSSRGGRSSGSSSGTSSRSSSAGSSSGGSSSRGSSSRSSGRTSRSTPTVVAPTPAPSSGRRTEPSSSPSYPTRVVERGTSTPTETDASPAPSSTAPVRPTRVSPYETSTRRTSPFREGSPIFTPPSTTSRRSTAEPSRAPVTEPGPTTDITTFGGGRANEAPTPTRRERLARAYRESFQDATPTTSKARERWLKKLREDAAVRPGTGTEQAVRPPAKDDDTKKDKKKKHKKKEKGHHGGHDDPYHDNVWHDGPGGPGWSDCSLWKGSFYGPLAYQYAPACGWYPNWFGAAPCWSPAWWCEWWPTYSVHPNYVYCVPTYVPVYDDGGVVYYPYDEVDYAEEFIPAEGVALPEEGVDPLLEAELLALSSYEDAVAFLEEGARLFAEGLYAEATDAFRRAMLAAPDNAVPKFAMANGLFALGEYGYADFLLRRGLSLLPTWPSAGPDLRDLYGDPDDLLEHQIALEVTVDLRPTDPDLRLVKGYVAFFTGDLDTAEHEFRVLLDFIPDDPFAVAFLIRIDEIRRLLDERGVAAEGYDPTYTEPIAGEDG